MIETFMIFALGFLVAGMLTLLFLPMFWRRAMRLSARRLELRIPLSITEIVAERDQLRAEFAAERRKLEQKSEKLTSGLADSRIELGARSARIVGLEEAVSGLMRDEAAAKKLNEQFEQELGALELERFAAHKAYYDASGILDRRTEELSQLESQHADLTYVSDEQRATIAGLEMQIAKGEMEFEALQKQHDQALKNLSEAISKAQFMGRERDQFRSDAVTARERREGLVDNIAAQRQLVEKLDADLRAARRQRGKLSDEISRRGEEADAAAATQQRLKQDLEVKGKVIAEAENNLAELRAVHSAGQAALQGALDAARRENQALRSELAGLRRNRGAGHGLTAALMPGPAANDGIVGKPRSDEMQDIRDAIAELGTELIDAAALDKLPGQTVELNSSNAEQRKAEMQARALKSKISNLQDKLLPSAAE